jgi:hypothetical protein
LVLARLPALKEAFSFPLITGYNEKSNFTWKFSSNSQSASISYAEPNVANV